MPKIYKQEDGYYYLSQINKQGPATIFRFSPRVFKTILPLKLQNEFEPSTLSVFEEQESTKESTQNAIPSHVEFLFIRES